jgi:hypothetical protein
MAIVLTTAAAITLDRFDLASITPSPFALPADQERPHTILCPIDFIPVRAPVFRLQIEQRDFVKAVDPAGTQRRPLESDELDERGGDRVWPYRERSAKILTVGH